MTQSTKKTRQVIRFNILQIILAFVWCLNTYSQQKIVRRPLLTAAPIDRIVKRAEVKEIIFTPLQKTGLHLHPCPVVGYIAKGTAIFQVKGNSMQTLKEGDAFYEPANTEMVHFDNASANKPLRFICFYLINDDKEIIKMLPEKK